MTEPLDATQLAGLGSILAVVQKLLAEGVTVTQMAEKVVQFVAPGDLPALQAVVSVLQEVEKLL